MILKSTKAYHKLPCAHAQYQDYDGPCKTLHGYDRSVIFEFSGHPDQYGWLVGFGQLKPVKDFLDYYFDHTTLIPAQDPRMSDIITANEAGLLNLRVLPYGVSMEMSSLFIWEQVNPFIYSITDGRAWISKVESREHDSNSAFVEIPEQLGRDQGLQQVNVGEYLMHQQCWPAKDPRDTLMHYRDHAITLQDTQGQQQNGAEECPIR